MPTKTEEWTGRLIIVGIGLFLLYTGWKNPIDWVVGVPFSVGPLIESAEFRTAFKFSFNRVSGGKFFRVDQSHAQAENIINVQGDSPTIQIGDKDKAGYTPNDLVEQAYTPLLKEAKSWLNPVNPVPTVAAWSNLESEKPYLIHLIPEDIAQVFNQAKVTYSRILTLNLPLTIAYNKATGAAREELRLTQARPSPGNVVYRIMSNNTILGNVWLGQLWASGKSLKQFATDFVEASYPGTGPDWELDLQIDGLTAGDNNTTLQFDEAVKAFLAKDPKAVEIQKKYAELRNLGLTARRRIEEEIKKLVRLKK